MPTDVELRHLRSYEQTFSFLSKAARQISLGLVHWPCAGEEETEHA